eukprot:COSAG03_NODE_1946_length_3315_cov_12.061878_6_plen_137_part_00
MTRASGLLHSRCTLKRRRPAVRNSMVAVPLLTLIWTGRLTSGDVHGSLDGLSPTPVASGAVGWAMDEADPLLPVTVRFYLNDRPPAGQLLGSTVTDQPRPDLKVAGNHGFSFAFPDKCLDNATHAVWAFAVPSAGE